jgi:von Willebrand factor type A domain
LRGSRPGTGRRLVRLCRYLAVAGIVLAAARPALDVEPAGRARVLELVVDVSGSTLADDVAPTRIRATQRAALRLLDQVPADLRVGLVSFSTEAETLVRPTTDHEPVRRRIEGLRSYGGTAIGTALQRALDDVRASTPAAPAAVLLVSDGANSARPGPEGPAATAAARRIPVLAVAVGTPQGLLTQPNPGRRHALPARPAAPPAGGPQPGTRRPRRRSRPVPRSAARRPPPGTPPLPGSTARTGLTSSIRPGKACLTSTGASGRRTRPSSAAAASRSSRWWTTVDTQARAQDPPRSGSRSATPATQATLGCAFARTAWARMPLDGSTAITSTSNHSAIGAANRPVPAPRSSTRRGPLQARRGGTAPRPICKVPYRGPLPGG